MPEVPITSNIVSETTLEHAQSSNYAHMNIFIFLW